QAMHAHLLSAARRGGIDMDAPEPPAAGAPVSFRLVPPSPPFPEGVIQ
ncbi:GntR family transcriptional regulator, partial [Paracidovorax avenae]